MLRTLITLMLVLPGTAAAVCPADTGLAALSQHLTRAEQAWTALDGDGFNRALEDVAFTLPCLTEQLTPVLAARTHRALALQAFGDGQERTAGAAFRAAHAASPAAGSPAALLPDGHAALSLYEANQLPIDRVATEPPPLYPLVFDGYPGLLRPVDVPTIAQVLDERGDVLRSGYVNPGQELPEYEVAPPPASKTGPGPAALPTEPLPATNQPERKALKVTLGTLTTLAAVSTAGLGGASVWSHQDFHADHPSWELRDLDAARERTNTLAIGTAVAGAVTATTGLTWVIVR